MRFEPTRGDHIGLAGRRLNHSAKVSCDILNMVSGLHGASKKQRLRLSHVREHRKQESALFGSQGLTLIPYCFNSASTLPRRVRHNGACLEGAVAYLVEFWS